MQLNLPQTNLNIRTNASGDRYIFDRLRHKFVALTPEEWVRQHFVDFLIEHKGYPAGLMANEVAITLNRTRRRCDTVVMDRFGKPMVIIEYKAQNIPITQAVFDQIVRYNMTLRVRCLIVSNGLKHYCCIINYEPSPTYRFLPDIPDYPSLVGAND